MISEQVFEAPGTIAEWFYCKNGREEGPISLNELKFYAAMEMIRPDTPVWRQGMRDWQPAMILPDMDFGPPPVPGVVTVWRESESALLSSELGAGSPVMSQEVLGSQSPPPLPKRLNKQQKYEFKLASLDKRICAFLIDWAMIGALYLLVLYVFAVTSENADIYSSAPGANAVTWLIAFCYFTVSYSSDYHATLGKRFMKIRLATIQGGNIGFVRAVWRNMVGFILIPMIAIPFPIIGCLIGLLHVVLVGSDSSSAPDWMSNTRAVEKI